MLAAAGIACTTTWVFLGATRRHTIVFSHNTFTGTRRIFVDDAELFSTGWRYSLTGAMLFHVDGSNLEIMIRADASGALHYELSADSKFVPPVESTGGSSSGSSSLRSPAPPPPPPRSSEGVSTWVLNLPTRSSSSSSFSSSSPGLSMLRLCQIEFIWSRMEVLVDGVKVEAEGDFAEEGAGTTYSFGVQERQARITATPSTAAEIKSGARKMTTTLVVEGIEGFVPQCELLGGGGGGGDSL
jgi:hypothetical protein